MRWIAIVVFGLGIMTAARAAWSVDSKDFQANAEAVRTCVEAGEKAAFRNVVGPREPNQPKPASLGSCVGQEKKRCLDDTERNDYEPFRQMYCADAEVQVWNLLLESAYARLLDYYDKCDRDRCAGTQDGNYEPIVPGLERLHEAWMTAKDRHCELVRIHAGSGTMRYDAPVNCELEHIAGRALLYREWLRWGIR